MKLVIHIGSHKTGSTSIQDYCFMNESRLQAHGIYYPTNLFDAYPRQHSFLCSFITEEGKTKAEKLLIKIVERAKILNCHTVFMSGEDFCSLGRGRVALFSSLCKKVFSEQMYVLVVRNKRDYLYSSYKHHLRYGPLVTEHGFKERNRFSPVECIESWDKLFGEGEVLSYDLIKKNLLSKFFQDTLSMDVEENISSNESLDFLMLQVVNVFLKPHMNEEIEKILWDVSKIYSNKVTYPIESKVSEDIDSCFDDLEWRSEKLDIYSDVLLEKKLMASSHDPVYVSRKMCDLFSRLTSYFEGKRLEREQK